MSPLFVSFLKRFFLLALVTVILVLGVSELAYRLMRDPASREPTQVKLVIPAGTAQLVASGAPQPSIPEEMMFVAGDTLVVQNDDRVAHELGPLWVPAGASASLKLDEANDYVYSCSFRSSGSIDLTVRQSSNWGLRLQALFYGGAPTLMFLLVYSFVLYPLKQTADR